MVDSFDCQSSHLPRDMSIGSIYSKLYLKNCWCDHNGDKTFITRSSQLWEMSTLIFTCGSTCSSILPQASYGALREMTLSQSRMPPVGKTSAQYFGSWTGLCSNKPSCKINLHLLKRGFSWSFQGSHLTLYHTLQFSYKPLKAGCFGIFWVCSALLFCLRVASLRIWGVSWLGSLTRSFLKCLGFLCPEWCI